MKRKVLETIKKHHMLEKGDRVLVALSGGADSAALLLVLKELEEELGITVFAANLNHNIRGEESDGDSLFVKELCGRLGVRLFYKSVDIPSMAKRDCIGEEECGRRERYRFFDEAAKELGGAKTATGHHMGDNAETALFHLFRGCAGRGLSGIPYVRGNIIRPLLDMDKSEIEAYLREKGETWRVDSTNFSDEYTRNRIRNVILPEIKKLFPDAERKIVSASQCAALDEEYFISEAEGSGAFENGGINAEKFALLHESVRRRAALIALREWNVKDASFEKIRAVCDIALGATGRSRDVGSGVRIINDYGFVHPCNLNKSGFERTVKTGENAVFEVFGGYVEIKTVDKCEKMRNNKRIAIFDADKAGDIELRTRRDGDRIAPVGMNGTKKLKQLFIDMKIPREKRDSIILAAKGSDILFVPGIRASGLYEPDGGTQRFLIIKYIKREEV